MAYTEIITSTSRPQLVTAGRDQIQVLQKHFSIYLQDFSDHFIRRLREIDGRFASACAQDINRKSLYENEWKPRLAKLRKQIEEIASLAPVRPSLCVMGKRGQGKTSLLQHWLGRGDVNPGGGIPEIENLPTGEEDSTACLIRMTLADSSKADLSPHFLYVDLFEPGIHPNIEKPPLPPLNKIRILRTGIHDETAPYRVCRFPATSDHYFRIAESQDFHVVDMDGVVSLTDVQWHAREARMPVAIFGHTSLAGEVLQFLDIIDAPGADSMKSSDTYSDWKRMKNSEVFKKATHTLDVLLVVCSANVDAMNIGAQFQEDIWNPWLQRCQGAGLGRMLLAVTHAGYLFKSARPLLEYDDSKRERLRNPMAPGRELRPPRLHESNFRQKLMRNVLEPLMIGGEESALIFQTDVTTWPPIFFFENGGDELKDFNIPDGSAEDFAQQLIQRIGEEGDNAYQDVTLPLGGRCILWLVRDWSDLPAAPAERLAVQQWLIHALCAVLDPSNRGFALLTETVIKYATAGPVAKNHCDERLAAVNDVWRKFEELLSDMGQPANNASALQEVRQAQVFLQSIWKQTPEGLRGLNLKQGGSAARRLEDVTHNTDPTSLEHRDFDFRDVARDIVQDVLSQLPGLNKESQELQDSVRRTLQECLMHDYPFVAMSERYRGIYPTKREPLMRLQAVAIERLARIIDYLVSASSVEQKKIARHCFELNLEHAALLESVIKSGIGQKLAEDAEVFEDVQKAGDSLLAAIRSAAFQAPYSVTI